jgi:uracil-DNA glycosylase family 4
MSGIDSRSAAFLNEMGITPLWTVRGAPAPEAPVGQEAPVQAPAAAVAAPVQARTAAPIEASVPEPVPVQEKYSEAWIKPQPPAARSGQAESAWGDDPPAPPATDEEIAQMDWAQLKTAIANCTRCGLCQGGRKPVYGNGAQKAAWFVAAGASTAADEKERQPLSGDAGKLLANMLAAVDLSRETNAYVTNLIKCRPTSASGGDRAPSADEAAACRPYLDRELALTGAPMVLTLGQIAANALQGKPLQEPLAGSRGQVHEVNGVKLVATLHPGELLRRGADKALAWADLCLARAHDGRAH